MRILKKSCILTLLTLVIFLSVVRVPASAAALNINKTELTYFQSVTDKNVSLYKRIAVELNGVLLSDVAYLINDTTYIPLRAVVTMAGAKISYNGYTRAATVYMSGLEMTVSDGSYVVMANGRALLSKTPSTIMSDGKMYIPIRVLAKALSYDVQWLPEGRVKLGGVGAPLVSADKYYNADDLYWLSKIISAESRGEPLLGQIAVGNVVLNRKRHPDYPSTVYGVIFDRKYGVQFSPVADGSIYANPTYSSVMAAKICLEGVSVSEKILFFMQPKLSTSSWISDNRRYAFTIQNHYFFY